MPVPIEAARSLTGYFRAAMRASRKMQRHVDSRRHSGRRNNFALLDESLGTRLRAELAELFDSRPMRRRRQTFQQSGGPEHQRARTVMRIIVLLPRYAF